MTAPKCPRPRRRPPRRQRRPTTNHAGQCAIEPHHPVLLGQSRELAGISRRCAKLHQQRSGASAPPRPASVMLLCILFMNLLSASTSYVRRRPYPSIRSQSTKVGSYATSQAFWCTRTLEEHNGARFAEGPECRRPSRTSSSAAAREIYKSASTVF